MRIIWSGVHERRKALPILLLSIANSKRLCANLVVDVLGDGPECKNWQKTAGRLGIATHIRWHGWVERDKAEQLISNADVFILTSLHDLTTTVVMEAIKNGKPVVCLDHCGFSDVVDESCGIKIPVGRPKEVIEGFTKAIRRLENRELRERLSRGAFEKSKQYLWSEKSKVLKGVYGSMSKKVLVSVYACSPYRGSEPGMGWHFLKAIAENNEVWAIVEEEKWRADIEKYLAEHPTEMRNVRWTFIHKPRARILRKIWPPSYYWFYRIWQWRAYKKACELHKTFGFDLVHQLNMVGFREPGYLWKLKVPFVWGPVGGLGYTDWRLLGLLPLAGKVEFLFRNIINWFHSNFLLRPRFAAMMASKTGALITATSENQREAKRLWGTDSIVLCEVGT